MASANVSDMTGIANTTSTFDEWIDGLLTDPAERAAWHANAPARVAMLILAKFRNRRKWPTAKLAKALNLSEEEVLELEIGERVPSLETLTRLADLLDLEIDIALRPGSDARLVAETEGPDTIVETSDRATFVVRRVR